MARHLKRHFSNKIYQPNPTSTYANGGYLFEALYLHSSKMKRPNYLQKFVKITRFKVRIS